MPFRPRDPRTAVRSAGFLLPADAPPSLSIGLGVAHVPRHSRDRRGLCTSAASAFHEAERGGRGRVALAPAEPPATAPGGA